MRYVLRAVAPVLFLALASAPLAVHAQPIPKADLVIEVGPSLFTEKATLVESIISAVNSAADHTLEYVLNGLAWDVANLAIESMTQSVVNWINSGFQGSPAFVTDLNRNLRGVADAVASRFFEELANQEIATTPFQDRVLDGIRLAYYLRTSPESFYTRNPYTLGEVSPDSRAFLQGDFSQGGFNAFYSAFMNPSNNPYGAQILANQALEDAVAGATGNRLEELSWNSGFLSWRGECISRGEGVDLSGKEECLDYEVRTPGSVIVSQLNEHLASGINRTMLADEFNEIVAALLNQLAINVIGGGSGGGLSGLSRPSSGGGGNYFQSTGGSGNTTNVGSTFQQTVNSQREQLARFQASWERIRSAAEAARDRCGAEAGDPSAQEVLDRASNALVRAASGLTAIDELLADITAALAAGGNQSVALLEITNRYNTLMSSSTLPSANEVAEAQTESQDTGDAEPGSLYSQMVRLSNSSSCRDSGD